MFKKVYLFLILLLFLPIVLSAETEIFSDSFDYNDSYTNHGWTYLRTWDQIPNTPVDYSSPYMTPYTFGWNQTSNTVASTVFALIHRTLPQNISSGTVSFSYDIDIINSSLAMSSDITSNLADLNLGDLLLVDHRTNGVTLVTNSLGGDNCDSSSVFNYSQGFRANVVIQLDIDNNFYNVFYMINDTVFQSIGCEGKTLHGGSMTPIVRIEFTENWRREVNQTKFLDNILLSTEFINQTVFSIGQPCDSDDDCFSGNCEYTFCAFQTAGEFCDSDSDCLSGDCSNGKCTRAGIWGRIDSSKTQQFGDDNSSNNFIALFFMIGLPFFIILAGRSKVAVIGSILVYFGLAFFFTIVGWLSPFILIGSVLSALILVVFGFMLSGSSA